jgi:hypothetical protein
MVEHPDGRMELLHFDQFKESLETARLESAEEESPAALTA